MTNTLLLIAAISSMIGTITGLVVAVKTQQTHTMVDGQRTAMQQLLQDKDDALQKHGIDIPHDTSLLPEGDK